MAWIVVIMLLLVAFAVVKLVTASRYQRELLGRRNTLRLSSNSSDASDTGASSWSPALSSDEPHHGEHGHHHAGHDMGGSWSSSGESSGHHGGHDSGAGAAIVAGPVVATTAGVAMIAAVVRMGVVAIAEEVVMVGVEETEQHTPLLRPWVSIYCR